MRMVLLAVIAAVVFEVFVVVFAASADKTQVRNLPKWAWVLICLVIPVIGPLAYLVFGRPIFGGKPYFYDRDLDPEPEPVKIGGGFATMLKNFLGLEDDYEPGPNVAPQFKYRDEARPRTGPVAPDDDPEFLRELDELLKSQADAPVADDESDEGAGDDGSGEAEAGQDVAPQREDVADKPEADKPDEDLGNTK